MPTVAIASEFLDAFAQIPRAQQKKVREFTEKFRANPKSSAINYEKDPHGPRLIRCGRCRIDQKYRAVVLHPDQGECIYPYLGGQATTMRWPGPKNALSTSTRSQGAFKLSMSRS